MWKVALFYKIGVEESESAIGFFLRPPLAPQNGPPKFRGSVTFLRFIWDTWKFFLLVNRCRGIRICYPFFSATAPCPPKWSLKISRLYNFFTFSLGYLKIFSLSIWNCTFIWFTWKFFLLVNRGRGIRICYPFFSATAPCSPKWRPKMASQNFAAL